MNGKPPSGSAGATRRLVESAQRGDRAAHEELVRRYEPLVRRVVWNIRPPRGCEREDLAQETRIGLVAAIRAWRPHRGPFPAFADRCVRNQALLAVQAAVRHKHQLLTRAMSLDGEQTGVVSRAPNRSETTLLDTIVAPKAEGDPETTLLIAEQLASIVGALPTLTQSERRALAGALAGESYERLGTRFGGTRKAASQAAYRARQKLAAALPPAA